MAAFITFGDAEAATVAILRGSAEVAAFTGVNIAADLVGYVQGQRWVKVTRTGGAPTMWMLLDSPTIELSVYAEDKGAAYDLTQAARGAMFAAQGAYSGHGLALYDVRDDTAGLRWEPDGDAARYLLTLQLITRPLAPLGP